MDRWHLLLTCFMMYQVRDLPLIWALHLEPTTPFPMYDCRTVENNTTVPCPEDQAEDQTIQYTNFSQSFTGAHTRGTLHPVEYFNWVTVPPIFILGIIGNLMTMKIMCSKVFARMSMSLTLLVLSLSDICIIIMQPFNKKFFMAAIGTDIRALSLVSCKVSLPITKHKQMLVFLQSSLGSGNVGPLLLSFLFFILCSFHLYSVGLQPIFYSILFHVKIYSANLYRKRVNPWIYTYLYV